MGGEAGNQGAEKGRGVKEREEERKKRLGRPAEGGGEALGNEVGHWSE